MQYEPPYNIEQIEKIYGRVLANRLLNDPVHRWRAKTGIELLHREPDLAEQKRTAANCRLMSEKQKRISDKKSVELFGKKNLERLDELLALHKHAGVSGSIGSASKRLFRAGKNTLRLKKYLPSGAIDDDQDKKDSKPHVISKLKSLFDSSKCGA